MAFPISWREPSRRLTSLAWWGLCSLSGASWVAWAAGASAPFKAPSSLIPLPPAQVPSAPMIDAAGEAVPSKPSIELSPKPTGLLGLKLGTHSAALIDGNWLKVGQSTKGAQLVDITQEGVHLRHANGRREIWVLSPDAQWTRRTPPVNVKAP